MADLTPLASPPALCSDGDTVHGPASALAEQGRGWLWAGSSSQAPMEASSVAVILRAGCCTRGTPCYRTEIPFGAGIYIPALLPGPAPLSVAVPSALGLLVGAPHGLGSPRHTGKITGPFLIALPPSLRYQLQALINEGTNHTLSAGPAHPRAVAVQCGGAVSA